MRRVVTSLPVGSAQAISIASLFSNIAAVVIDDTGAELRSRVFLCACARMAWHHLWCIAQCALRGECPVLQTPPWLRDAPLVLAARCPHEPLALARPAVPRLARLRLSRKCTSASYHICTRTGRAAATSAPGLGLLTRVFLGAIRADSVRKAVRV